MAEISPFVYATISERIKKIADAIIERNVLLSWLKDEGCLVMNKGGADVRGPVRISDSAIAGFTTDLGQKAAQTTSPALEFNFDWTKFIARPFFLQFQIDRNMRASNIAKIFDLAKFQLDEVKQSASSRIGRACYAASSTTESADNGTPIEGLEGIILATGTYGGLSRSTYSAWQSQVTAVANPSQDDNSDGVNNLIAGMQTLYMNVCGGMSAEGDTVKDSVATEKNEPKIAITTKTLYAVYKHGLAPQQRYTGRTGQDLTSLLFQNASVEWDPACTASRLYMLTPNHLKFWCVYPQLLMAGERIQDGNVFGYQIPVYGQHCLFSPNPRYLGKITTTGT